MFLLQREWPETGAVESLTRKRVCFTVSRVWRSFNEAVGCVCMVRFRKVFYGWLVCAVCGSAAAFAQTAHTVYLDPVGNNGPANWNNLSFVTTNATALLKDSQINATGIRLSVITPLQGPNNGASASPLGPAAEFTPAGTNSAYGNSVVFSGRVIPYGLAVFSNLNVNTAYTFTFYASRMNVTDNREALYTLTGENSGSNTLNASGNSSQTAAVSNIVPRADGTVELRLEGGPNNNEPSGFFYLTAMKVDYEEPAAPPAQERTTVYVDAAGTTAAPGWNLVGFNGLAAVLLADATNGVTGIHLQTTHALNAGLNGDATASPSGDAAEFQPAGAQNAYGLNTTYSYGTALLSGLDTNAAYTFTFYASRMGVTDNREALYTVSGANSGQATLNASDNTSRVAVVSDIVPSADGTIGLRLEKGPSNNNSSGYFYLNAFKITYPAGASGGPSPTQESPKRLLFFGNSFSLVDDVPGHVGSIAMIAGHPAPLILADLMGGTDLAYHITQVDGYPENNVTNVALAGTNTWDHVIIQGYSTEATALRDAMIFRTNSLALFRRVRDHASGKGAGVKPVLYQTWARAQGHSYYPDTFPDPADMQNQIRTNYQEAATLVLQEEPGTDVQIACVGDAFERDAFSPADLYASDLYHAGNLGPRLAALILYKTIYGATVTNIPYADVKAAGWTTMGSNDWTRVTYWAEGLTPPELPVTTNPPPATPGYGTREVYLLDAANGDAATLPGWNALALNAAGSTALVMTNGYETDVTCTVVTRMNGVNANGAAAPSGNAAVFLPAGANNAYGNVNPFNAYSNSHALVRFSGLNPSRHYTFTCYASRMSATDCRETLYTISGANRVTALLDAANNSTEVAVLQEVLPQEDGTVDLRIEPGPNNTSTALFYHLTALKIESVRRGFIFLIGP